MKNGTPYLYIHMDFTITVTTVSPQDCKLKKCTLWDRAIIHLSQV